MSGEARVSPAGEGLSGRPAAGAGAAPVPALAAEGLTVRYPGAARPALEAVDLRVPPGTMYAVLGPNGSGKSTLMRALLGGVPAAAGAVRVAGRALEAWNRRALARHAAAVPQLERPAFPVSVRDFVALGRYPHLGPLGRAGPRDAEAVERALARCDAADLARRDVTTLSGGELQRVRIARALAQEPETLLLDEPTASLDVGHEMAILELLRASADGGLTVLLVTHHLNAAARFADQILLLDAGRVAAEGAPQTVLRRDTLERVYRWPMETGRDPHTGALTVSPLPARGRLHGEDAESP